MSKQGSKSKKLEELIKFVLSIQDQSFNLSNSVLSGGNHVKTGSCELAVSVFRHSGKFNELIIE